MFWLSLILSIITSFFIPKLIYKTSYIELINRIYEIITTGNCFNKSHTLKILITTILLTIIFFVIYYLLTKQIKKLTKRKNK